MNEEMTIRDAGQQDLAGIVSRFRRHVPISVAIIGAMLILAFVATQMMPRKYTAVAELNFAPQESLVKGPQQSSMTDAQRDAALEAQLQIAQSPRVAALVLSTLDLRNDPELRGKAAAFGAGGNTREALIAALLQDVSARRIGQTPLFQIGYTSSDPIRAARIANAFAEAFLVTQRQQKLEQLRSTAQQLDERVELLRRQAEQADAAVARFRVDNHLINNPDSTSVEQEIATIATQLADARAAAALARSRSSSASQATVVGGGSNGPLDTSTLSRLREQRAQQSSQLAALQARYGDRHPLVIDARQQLADIDAAIAREMEGFSRSAGAESSGAAARVASLEASLAAARARLAGNVKSGVQLADLQRKADTARELYQNLLGTRGDENARSALVQPDARQVSQASPPLQPSSPRLLINLIVGFVVGATIALGLAYLRERWSQTLNTIDDIERLLQADFLNSIPTMQSAIAKPQGKDPIEGVMAHPLSSYAESFRSLATTLIYRAKASAAPGGRVIGLTSALPREGKTTTTIAMARVLAMAGTEVAVVDADLRRRSVTQMVAPDAQTGWTDALDGSMRLADVMHKDASGAMILPLAPRAHEAQRPFEGTAFKSLLDRLRADFDVILVDTAPVLAVVDTRMMASHFDTLAMLARWRSTPVKAIRAALHQLETVGCRATGVAMTLVNLKTQAQSGYGDASYYYDQMKDYYVAS